jgi:integrase/recombinase XerD
VQWCGQIRSIPFKRCEKNSITYLEKEEIDALLEVPDQSTRLGHRDYALLLFLYNSGARASEAVHVTIEDLERNPDGTGSVKLHGKAIVRYKGVVLLADGGHELPIFGTTET